MSPERGESGLCPHGKLPGICQECLQSEAGQISLQEISENAKNIGSIKAQELWKALESEGMDPKEYIYDVVMVLGAGYREDKDHLNIESRMRLNAAAQLYLEGRTRILCVTGGPALSEKWKELPPLADLGKKYLVEKFGIPEQDIILENVSDATHGNLAHGLREVHKQQIPLGKFGIISTDYHLNRARKMANKMGIKASTIPAESVLLRRSRHYRKFVSQWLQYAQDAGLDENEMAKMADDGYWEERSGVFETPLDQDVPPVDITASVLATAERLTASGGEGIQTDAF